MKLKLSFKVHFYCCFRYYIAYAILLALSLILKYLLPIEDNIYSSYIILSGLLFSGILGVYEYLIVLHTYLNFQPNPRAFWLQSIFANIINSIVCIIILILFNTIILLSGGSIMIFDNIGTVIILFIFTYSLGAFGYVMLHRIKYLTYISIIVLIILVIFFGNIIHNGLLNFVTFYLTHKIICLIPLALATIFQILILFRLKRFIK